jgi:SAM-dependent methyltransferase
VDSKKDAFIRLGIEAILCPNCRSASKLELGDNQVVCRACNMIYRFIDGVLELMPPDYDGYPGDSMEAAALRDAHNRQALREDTIHLRSLFDQLLRPKSLLLDAGCGTGHLAKIISEGHPDVTIIATDVSLPMCQLAAKNCRGQRVLVIRTPTSKNPPMPFQNSAFDIVLNRLAHMYPREAFRLLRTGGATVEAKYIDAQWQEIR